MSATAVKLDPRIRRTQRLLQGAFLQLMREKSFQQITIQDITERAEVNRGTFYDHFEDKYALLGAVVRDAFQERLQPHLRGIPHLSASNLRVMIMTASDYFSDFAAHCAPGGIKDEQLIILAQVQHHLYETLLAWMMTTPMNDSASGTSPETMARVTSGAIFGSLLHWAREGRRMPSAQLADEILTALQVGVPKVLSQSPD
jgi:AcrR family transcriptional regulator